MASMVVMQQNMFTSSMSFCHSSISSDFNGVRLTHSLQYKRNVVQPKGGLHITASSAKKILIMGGTRFIGIFLSRLLVKEGHQVTLFTRGKAPIAQQLPGESDADFADFSSKILHLKGDRQDFDFVKSSLSADGYDVVYDINGREAVEVEPILDALPNLEQYIYCSSAGVYLKTDTPPHCEVDAVDPKSRHKGKLDTESLLSSKGVNWTAIRPVYIYGPLNYNPVEEWFFHRLKAGRPIPIPGSGVQITQLGHVKDLAKAFIQVLGNEKASREVFNISGEKYVTFDGLAKACAKDNTVELKTVLNGNKNSEYCRPLNSFDWNEAEPRRIGTSSIDTTCTIWDVEKETVDTQLIAHDEEVYDIAWGGAGVFASVSTDGSVRVFDLRDKEHSTIIYESSEPDMPLVRLGWNKQDPSVKF